MNDGGTSGLLELAKSLYDLNDPNRKPNHYFQEYGRIFAPIRYEKVRILELGVFSGASLLIWRDYFPSGIIVGLDLTPPPSENILNSERIFHVQGDQSDALALDRAVEVAGGPFDIIIDDASHVGYLTKKSFMHLFPKHLRAGGHYIIEDIGSSFLPQVFDEAVSYVPSPLEDTVPAQKIFPSYQNGLTGFIKQLMDHVQNGTMTTPKILQINRLTIVTNMVIVEKCCN